MQKIKSFSLMFFHFRCFLPSSIYFEIQINQSKYLLIEAVLSVTAKTFYPSKMKCNAPSFLICSFFWCFIIATMNGFGISGILHIVYYKVLFRFCLVWNIQNKYLSKYYLIKAFIKNCFITVDYYDTSMTITPLIDWMI